MANYQAHGDAKVLHKPGAMRLDGFPRLAYSPKKWGEGVRVEDSGALVEDIARQVGEGKSQAEVATEYGTTEDHVREAMAYAVRMGLVS